MTTVSLRPATMMPPAMTFARSRTMALPVQRRAAAPAPAAQPSTDHLLLVDLPTGRQLAEATSGYPKIVQAFHAAVAQAGASLADLPSNDTERGILNMLVKETVARREGDSEPYILSMLSEMAARQAQDPTLYTASARGSRLRLFNPDSAKSHPVSALPLNAPEFQTPSNNPFAAKRQSA